MQHGENRRKKKKTNKGGKKLNVCKIPFRADFKK